MAFGSGNAGGGNPSAAVVNEGPDLGMITTERLGFLAIANDAKVRLATAWEPMPSPTARLLSIASRKGLVAAAGPDQITISSTESVRKAFEAEKNGNSDVRDFNPQLRMPMPMRISQLTFTADENYLVLSAESGGGLAVYDVQSLLSGSTNTAFELPTNGESLRALVPNPTAEKGELCAIVTANGNLYMADLKERRISDPLKTQVSSVTWSSKGKQLCAGLADGTIHQMTPDGTGKADIPRPQGLENNHVSQLTWLENDMWLAIYTSSGDEPTSTYNIITRQQGSSSFTFQKIPDPIAPFMVEKPPQHTVLRLRDWPPDLKDLLIVSSTAMPDFGLLTRATKSLSSGSEPGSTDVFAMTEIDDNRRPTLPMSEAMDDSTAIGLALDLSSKDKVYKPIPMDEEIEESPNPLPAMWALTHEGVLCLWWLVYEDSIKEGKPYPGLAVLDTSAAPSQATTTAPAASTPSFAAPAKPSFGSPSTPGPFGSSTPAASFGSTTPAAPSFGSSTQLGLKSSPWGAPSTSPSHTGSSFFGSGSFGNSSAPSAPSAPAFGKPSTPGFGQASQLGGQSSPWGSGGGLGASSSGGGSSAPAFGQSGFAGFANKPSNPSPWGTATQDTAKPTEASSSGGFAGFSQSGGFASVASANTGGSVFGSGSQTSSNPFGLGKQEDTAFPPKAADDKASASPFGSQPFKLASSFQASATPTSDGPKPADSTGSSMFGSNFGSALEKTKEAPQPQQVSQEVEMDAETPVNEPPTPQPQPPAPQPKPKSLFDTQDKAESTTPQSTPTNKFMSSMSSSTTATPGTSLFGKPTPSFGSGNNIFGSGSGNFFNKPKESSNLAPPPETPKIKREDSDVPLPPDTTSKSAYPLGESSSSSAASNATAPLRAPAPPSSSQTLTAPSVDLLATPKPNKDSVLRVSDTPQESHTPQSTIKTEAPPRTLFANLANAPLPPSDDESEDEDDNEDDDEDENEDEDEDEDEEEEDENENESEGSGIDVANDLSPDTNDKGSTLGFNSQASSTFLGSKPAMPQAPTSQEGSRPFFGGLGNKPALFPAATDTSPRSPSPVRGAVPSRMSRADTRSVSAPGMASQLLNSRNAGHRPTPSASAWKDDDRGESLLKQLRKEKNQKEADERQLLIDTEDDQIQALLASEIEPTLVLDEFIAHTNSGPPAQESVPSQVEAVYRDINSMIDAIGLNARAVKSFIKGHSEPAASTPKDKNDIDDVGDWVLCEVDALGNILDNEIREDLETGRVQDLEGKLKACRDLTKDMHRLRAKREDLAKLLAVRMDPSQSQAVQSMALSAEQAAQQNELRKEFARFSTLLGEAEEALTLLKAKIASSSKGSGRTAMPTVEAVMRTITKMTSLVEQRSGDIDVLEIQMRRLGIGSRSREGSPMVTPQARRSIMFSPESTPSRTLRHSFAASMGSVGSPSRGTPPRKRMTTFTDQEKMELKGRRDRRQAVLGKLKDSVEKKGPVQVWGMEETE